MNYSIIPGRRISTSFQPELVIYTGENAQLSYSVVQNSQICKEFKLEILGSNEYTKINLDFTGIIGEIELHVSLKGNTAHKESIIPYEIINSPVRSTRLLDGCWISLIHWSNDEARHFNNGLRKLTDDQWKDKIEDMHKLGIHGVMIQNMFDSTAYVFEHNQGLDQYEGKAFYPSKLYPQRYEGLAINDPLEAILTKADELDMQVFVGVGLYAWFDYSKDSLEWHKRVATELYEMYGHHKSFYSFYISEELHGSFYDTYRPERKDDWTDVVYFFEEFKKHIKKLAPTKPISMAPNNIDFHLHREKWEPTLKNIDILLPFAFARDLNNLNIKEIQEICDTAGTHFWVDMEIFDYPFDQTGLVPKPFEGLLNEIKIYDDVENIFGYQYSGLINNPEHDYGLGNDDTKIIFERYLRYYENVKKGKFQ